MQWWRHSISRVSEPSRYSSAMQWAWENAQCRIYASVESSVSQSDGRQEDDSITSGGVGGSPLDHNFCRERYCNAHHLCQLSNYFTRLKTRDQFTHFNNNSNYSCCLSVRCVFQCLVMADLFCSAAPPASKPSRSTRHGEESLTTNF